MARGLYSIAVCGMQTGSIHPAGLQQGEALLWFKVCAECWVWSMLYDWGPSQLCVKLQH